VLIPFLALELRCLPSEIRGEMYNDIEAVIEALEYKNNQLKNAKGT
jgi:hypothetical protein